MKTRPWGPDGALLCNFTTKRFKLNFQGLGVCETFEYGMWQTVLPNLEGYARR